MARKITQLMRRNKARKENFAEMLSAAGHLAYFTHCVRTRLENAAKMGVSKLRPDIYWETEAKRWGYSHLWLAGAGISVPVDAPPPVYDAPLLPKAKLTKIQAEKMAREVAKEVAIAAATAPPPPPVDPNSLPDVVFSDALDYRTMIKWTLGAIGIDPDSIPPRQIPSPACLMMLRTTTTDKGRERFFALVKQQEEEDAEKAKVHRSFEDDKQKHFKLFDKILEDLERKKRRMAANTPAEEIVA